MQFVKDFFDFLYSAGIALKHLDAIHDIAKHNTDQVECRAFEEWYRDNVAGDDED